MNATDQSPPALSDVLPIVTREVWADLIALELPASPPAPAKRPYGLWLRQLLLFGAPVACAWLALNIFLPPVYVSETSFILRHQAETAALPSSGTDLSGTPSESGSADSYAVRDFLLSRDAMNAAGGSFAGAASEASYRDFGARVAVDYETSSGVITIRAKGHTAQQAHDLAAGLANAAGTLIARFNHDAGASEYLATLATPNLPDSPTKQDQPLVMLGAAALGLALAWSRRT